MREMDGSFSAHVAENIAFAAKVEPDTAWFRGKGIVARRLCYPTASNRSSFVRRLSRSASV